MASGVCFWSKSEAFESCVGLKHISIYLLLVIKPILINLNQVKKILILLEHFQNNPLESLQNSMFNKTKKNRKRRMPIHANWVELDIATLTHNKFVKLVRRAANEQGQIQTCQSKCPSCIVSCQILPLRLFMCRNT